MAAGPALNSALKEEQKLASEKQAHLGSMEELTGRAWLQEDIIFLPKSKTFRYYK